IVFLSAFYAFITPGKILLKQAMVGGFICAVMMEIAKQVFGWFITHNPFGIVYGSLNAIILMVLWIFYASVIFLFCAEVIFAYQKNQQFR
ncbi:MAG TPA: YhjD/YihY/BrkB family envelope integrity protein, partial [Desulfatiglandales bacterium]|nr:YhjD/YihY/BrkB family envelope integrity protein [Desulfatiglandales bacterium]